jgi:hypothetical protein
MRLARQSTRATSSPDRERKFVGVVREVRAIDESHVSVRIEPSDDAHRRLVLGADGLAANISGGQLSSAAR